MNGSSDGSFGAGMVDWVHREIRELTAYRVAPSDGMIKLDAMESPYGFEPSIKQQWLEALGDIEVNRYPDPNGAEIKQLLAKAFSIPASLGMLLGNGSDELLQLIQLAVAGAGRSVMSPMPSFAMYEIIARYTRARFVPVALDRDFNLDQEAWFETLARENPACIFFAYPNNPTGNLFDESLIAQTAEQTSAAVVVDEAYFAYAQKSLIDLVQHHRNLLILRTLSKSGLAGLRLGYLVGEKGLIGELNKVRLPYNINALTDASVRFALNSWDRFDARAKDLIGERERLAQRLRSLGQFAVYPSHANFIAFRYLDGSADWLYESLKSRKILIRNLHGAHPLLEQCLRTTVGTPHENEALVEALVGVLDERHRD